MFINPGSAGLPLDCEAFEASCTLLTVEADKVMVEERRISCDVERLIAKVKENNQYAEARVWSEIIFKEWMNSREHVGFFLEFAEGYGKI